MKRILFMPFLQISSGHHQVANVLSDSINELNDVIECEKIDILSYSYGNMEVFISSFYIKWIHTFPGFYSWLYKRKAINNNNKRFLLYEWFFLSNMEKLIKEKNPHLIICTHAFPSYLLSQLKTKGITNVPIINVYTDYFINQIWGTKYIDYHFVPHSEIKDVLIERGVKSNQIIVTGIPIHTKFMEHAKLQKRAGIFSVLISGGNLGTGKMKTFIKTLKPTGKINYIVLCGKNDKLYNWIKQMNIPFIYPICYIESKEKMNRLYENVDAIITKPGGVTISECLYKKIPIFVYHELPGQEEINLDNLINWGLVYHLDNWQNTSFDIEEKIVSTLLCKNHQNRLNQKLNLYHQQISHDNPHIFIDKILKST